MTIRAYNKLYLDDAMQTLAEMFAYVPDAESADKLFELFVMSGIATQFGRGNPRYMNMPPQVLFDEVTKKTMSPIQPCPYMRSPEYWCGFVLAYYQWYTGLSFEQIGKHMPPSKIISMYNPLHEAGLEKFVDVANALVRSKETNLARYRKTARLTQQELSRYSQVSLRSIQLYEQRNLDINMAPAIKLLQLSCVLGCHIEDLLEPDNQS